MRLPSTFRLTRSFLGGCAFLLLCPLAALAQQEAAWREHYSLGFSAAHARFAYRHNVADNLRLPLVPLPSLALGLTRQLTERFAVGADERVSFINHSLRYRYRGHGAGTAGVVDGMILQLGLNAQLTVPLGLRWELAVLTNASVARPTFFGSHDRDAAVWRAGSGDDQTLTLRISQPRKVGFFTGAELRLIRWLGDAGTHGLQLTVGYQQGLRTLLRADSREFSYPDASGQRQQGAFGLRFTGSHSSVQLGYCYAWGQMAAPAKRRWSSPRYSQPPTPPDEEPEPDEAADAE